MESTTKRIIAIALIAVIGVGIGVGAWVFLIEDEATNPYEYPGLGTEQKSLSRTIKLGLLDDMSWSGLGAWRGAEVAARRINLAGGVTIGGNQYWVGLVAEDTKEAAYDFDTATAAANTMVGHKPNAIMGGFRSEVFSNYQDIVMAGEIPFLITGTATEDWCKLRVGNFYDFYKYTFRLGPLNNKRMGVIVGNYINSRILGNITAHTGNPVTNITIVYENLMWTADVMGQFITTVQSQNPTISFTTEPIPAGGLAYNYDALYGRILASGTNLIVPIISDPAVGGAFGGRYNAYTPDALVVGINVLAQFNVYMAATTMGALYEVTSHGFAFVNLTDTLLDFLDEYVAEYGAEPIYTTMNAYNAVTLIVDEFVAADKVLTNDEIVTALEVYSNYTSFYQGINTNVGFDEFHDQLPQNGTNPFGWGENLFRQWQPLNLADPYNTTTYSCPIVPGWFYGQESLGIFDSYIGPTNGTEYPTIGGKPIEAYKNSLIFPHWW